MPFCGAQTKVHKAAMLISKGYQSDFGTVPADKIPEDIGNPFTSPEAKEQLDRMIWEAWNKADKQTLHKLGLKYV
jgi:hypothetical protein